MTAAARAGGAGRLCRDRDPLSGRKGIFEPPPKGWRQDAPIRLTSCAKKLIPLAGPAGSGAGVVRVEEGLVMSELEIGRRSGPARSGGRRRSLNGRFPLSWGQILPLYPRPDGAAPGRFHVRPPGAARLGYTDPSTTPSCGATEGKELERVHPAREARASASSPPSSRRAIGASPEIGRRPLPEGNAPTEPRTVPHEHPPEPERDGGQGHAVRRPSRGAPHARACCPCGGLKPRGLRLLAGRARGRDSGRRPDCQGDMS